MPKIAIVGGGLSGLSLALRLRTSIPGAHVTLFEKADRLGGNIGTVHREGFRVETGPNGFLDSKPHTLRLCRDLGIADRLIHGSEAARKNRYLFWKGRLQALPGSFWSFITSPLLSWRGKLNLLLEPYRRRPRGVKRDESIAEFSARRAGKEVAQVFADALVTGIHAGDPRILSMAAAFPRVTQFEREYGSVMRGFTRAAKQRRAEAESRGEIPLPQRMWSFREGLGALIEALRIQCGAECISGIAIRSLSPDSRSNPAKPTWILRGDGTETWQADAVALACPADQQASLVAELDASLAEQMASIPYTAIVIAALGFRAADCPHQPDGFGYIAPQATLRDLLGVQWCSSIFPERAPTGMVLWRCLAGGWNRREMVDWSDDRLLRAVVQELRTTMKLKGEPIFQHIVRWPKALPQYTIGHLDRVAAIESLAARHRGLFLTGNAYHGVAMNDCTEQAEVVAGRIAEFLR